MDVPPPAYKGLEASGIQTLPTNVSVSPIRGETLTFADFIPTCVEPGGLFTSPIFANVSQTLQRVNAWLKSRPQWRVKSVETVRFRRDGDGAFTSTLSCDVLSNSTQWYLGAIRIWISHVPGQSNTAQQIGCIALAPQQLQSGGLLCNPVYESMKSMLDKFNKKISRQPIPGKILKIETIDIGERGDVVNPESGGWHYNGIMVNVVRIFYEVGPPEVAEIGFADFAPLMTSSPQMFENPSYEPFRGVVKRARDWCYLQTDLNIINFQSVPVHIMTDMDFNTCTQKMSHSDSSNGTKLFLRIVRVVYTRTSPAASVCQPRRPGSSLTYRTFRPEITSVGVFSTEYETLQSLQKRTTAWVKQSGAQVFCIETVQAKVGESDPYDPTENTLFSMHRTSGRQHIKTDRFVTYWRLYLEGHFVDPPKSSLPQPPKREDSVCLIM